MRGILLSLGILIPTILPRQTPLVPFPGIFSTYIGAHLSKRQFCFRPLSRGLFFNLIPISRQRRETQRRFRPLSRGPFFNKRSQSKSMDRPQRSFSSPFLRTFFQLSHVFTVYADNGDVFSSPFSRTFFQLETNMDERKGIVASFRPLSWGLFFNWQMMTDYLIDVVFVPFLGDFFSICAMANTKLSRAWFSSPFLGTFFNRRNIMTTEEELELFSSPFSGTFFQSSDGLLPSNRLLACVFVPFLGDFFQLLLSVSYLMVSMFSSPFSGTFFNLSDAVQELSTPENSFRPLYRGLFSILHGT